MEAPVHWYIVTCILVEAPPSPLVDLPLESAVISSPEHVIVKLMVKLRVKPRVKLRVINHHLEGEEKSTWGSFLGPISTQAEKESVQTCFCYHFSVI